MKEKLNELISKIDSRIRYLMQTPGYYNQARLEALEEVQEELSEIVDLCRVKEVEITEASDSTQMFETLYKCPDCECHSAIVWGNYCATCGVKFNWVSPKSRTDRLKEHVADTADCDYIGYASLD